MINETLDLSIASSQKEQRNISEQVNRLLEIMETDIPYSANDLMKELGIKSKETLRGSYLNPALENGLIKMSIPDKPNSKNQKYIKY
jgi:predicted HTH transcriptional regulator